MSASRNISISRKEVFFPLYNIAIVLFVMPCSAQAEPTMRVLSTDKGWVLNNFASYTLFKNDTVTSDLGLSNAITILDAPIGSGSGPNVVFGPPPVTLYNAGTISGPENSSNFSAIDFVTHGSLQNQYFGVIRGGEHAVRLLNGFHEVINDGIIAASTGNAISVLDGRAEIENYSVIEGYKKGIESNTSESVNITNYGSITGNLLEAIALNTESTIYNAGAISSQNEAAIMLSGNNNHLVLDTNSQINGKDGVALLSKGRGNTLLLEGNSSEDDSFLSDSASNGLVKITSAADSEWTLSGDISAYGAENDILDVAGRLTLAGNTVIEGGGGATVQESGVLALVNGGSLKGNLMNNGLLLVGNDTPVASVSPAFTTFGNVINTGEIRFSPGTGNYGNKLVVNGDYIGQPNSLLRMNGVLGNDSSPVDSLAINGNVSGTTNVEVTNVGGTGAATLEGIELIKVNGNSTNNAFIQKGRIVAGSYDYFLHRGSASLPQSDSWYLSSVSPAAPPAQDGGASPFTGNSTDEQDNGTGEVVATPDDKPLAQPTAEAAPSIPKPISGPQVLRPEAGAYAANNAIANRMFVMRLQDRLEAGKDNTSLWLRQTSTHQKSQIGSQIHDSGNQYVAQLGADLARFQAGEQGAVHFGVMAGYGQSHGKSISQITGYKADRSLQGYSGGLSATWYADEASHLGTYSDNWLQYSVIQNTVKGDGLSGETYNSKGMTASTELGYVFKFAASEISAFYLQPQAQIIWMDVHADDHQEANGSKVSSSGNGNIATRLGLRTSLATNVSNTVIKPFVETNWLHNSKPFGASMNGVTTEMNGTKDAAELKTGISATLNRNLQVVAEASLQKGHDGYQNTGGMISLRYGF